MKTLYKRALIAGVCLGVIGAVVVIKNDPYGKAVSQDTTITIASGSDFSTLKDSLKSSGVINNMATFELVARLRSLDQSVKAGHYTLKQGESYMSIVRKLRAGEQTPVDLTFNNIRSLEQLAGVISKSIEPDSSSLVALMKSDSVQKSYGLDQRTMMAMFIPDTYEFYWTTSAGKFMERMYKQYDNFWNEKRTAQLKALGLTRIEAITLASIVYEESKMVKEMPTIAGVYLNRLRIKMPLQADPTVKFAVGDPTLKRVLFKHLEVDSPYNTYKYNGLPPGPIAMPSVAAIESVLNPQKHNYLYFCAKADFSGEHAFARTLSEHNRNAAAYSRELNRRKIR
ncbi:MAG: endolytic transglycosylase MltG [Rikenellaceae bacterium]